MLTTGSQRGAADHAGHARSFRHTWRGRAFSALTLACLLLICEHGLNGLAGLHGELIGSVAAPVTDSRSAVVLINRDEYRKQFGRRSPLDRATLAAFIGRLNEQYAERPEIVPNAIAIDIDLSPVDDKDATSQGRKQLDAQLTTLAKHVPVVMAEPEPDVIGEAPGYEPATANWIATWRCRCVSFGSTYVDPLGAGFAPDVDTIGVVLRRLGQTPPGKSCPSKPQGCSGEPQPPYVPIGTGGEQAWREPMPLARSLKMLHYSMTEAMRDAEGLQGMLVVIGGSYDGLDVVQARRSAEGSGSLPSAMVHAWVADAAKGNARHEWPHVATIVVEVLLGTIISFLLGVIWRGIDGSRNRFFDLSLWCLAFWALPLTIATLVLRFGMTLTDRIGTVALTLFVIGSCFENVLFMQEELIRPEDMQQRTIDRVAVLTWAAVQWAIILFAMAGVGQGHPHPASEVLLVIVFGAACYFWSDGPLARVLPHRTLRRF